MHIKQFFSWKEKNELTGKDYPFQTPRTACMDDNINNIGGIITLMLNPAIKPNSGGVINGNPYGTRVQVTHHPRIVIRHGMFIWMIIGFN